MAKEAERRPIKAREAWWAKSAASALVKIGLSPNQVSVISVIVAGIGAALYYSIGKQDSAQIQMACFIGAAACIQLRLLCNMLDGMMAVEYGKQSKLGALFNDLPDRLADSLFLIFAGYAALSGKNGIVLGWAAALFAVLSAYIRVFGATQGLKQDFCGPMAKPHRMAALTLASLLAAAEIMLGCPHRIMTIALWIIVIGTVITCTRRTCHIIKDLKD